MVKQSHTKQSLLIALGLYQANYQILVIIYQKKIHSDNCTDCKSYLDYMSVEDNQLIFRYFECKKNYKKDFNKDLINRFANTYEFCNGEINKFVLLLRKVVYLMNTWIVGKDSMKLPFQIKIFLQRIESKRHY